DEGHPGLLETVEGFRAVLSLLDRIAGRLQRRAEAEPDIGLVIHDEDWSVDVHQRPLEMFDTMSRRMMGPHLPGHADGGALPGMFVVHDQDASRIIHGLEASWWR